MAEIFGFSLRIQEQCFSQICVAARTTKHDERLFSPLLATLLALKAANSDLYFDYVRGNATPEMVLQFIGKTSKGTVFLGTKMGMTIEAFLVSGRENWREFNSIRKKYHEDFSDNGLSEIQRERARFIHATIDHFESIGIFEVVPYLVKKIEISERFV